MEPKLLSLNKISELNGNIFVIEKKTKIFPFDIKRNFYVFADRGQIRGQHAHKKCSQLLVCLNGQLEVECLIKNKKKIYILKNPNNGLLIPPMVWAAQTYQKNNTILSVLCNKIYDENDYIRDYKKYLSYFSKKK